MKHKEAREKLSELGASSCGYRAGTYYALMLIARILIDKLCEREVGEVPE